VPFNEAAFLATSGSGSGAVVGQGVITMRDNSIRYANDWVDLIPVNDYTTEAIDRCYVHKGTLKPLIRAIIIIYGRSGRMRKVALRFMTCRRASIIWRRR